MMSSDRSQDFGHHSGPWTARARAAFGAGGITEEQIGIGPENFPRGEENARENKVESSTSRIDAGNA
jgi:hypothetical protein